jgi:tRNA 2-thiocytidine biosynthesis protein TtcA
MDLEKTLLRDMGRAIGEHRLIDDGDKIMVAISGGKDSYALLTLLRTLQKRAPVRFELLAVHLDQGQPGYDGRPLREWLQREGHPHEILREDTYSVVVDKVTEGKTYCSLCSRLRRGILYTAATRLGCNKIALGHHRDDALETLLLNLFFAGKLASMPAKLTSEDGAHVVIRPLIYCAEETLAAFARERAFPILPCNLCGSQSQAQRKQMKALLQRMEAEHPHVKQSMLAALGNVVPSHLLDRGLLERVHGGEARGDDPTLSAAGGERGGRVEDTAGGRKRLQVVEA